MDVTVTKSFVNPDYWGSDTINSYPYSGAGGSGTTMTWIGATANAVGTYGGVTSIIAQETLRYYTASAPYELRIGAGVGGKLGLGNTGSYTYDIIAEDGVGMTFKYYLTTMATINTTRFQHHGTVRVDGLAGTGVRIVTSTADGDLANGLDLSGTGSRMVTADATGALEANLITVTASSIYPSAEESFMTLGSIVDGYKFGDIYRESESTLQHIQQVYSNTAGITTNEFVYRSGGTVASQAAAPTDAVISRTSYYVSDDALGYEESGKFEVSVDGAIAVGDLTTQMTWSLKNGSATMADVMSLSPSTLTLLAGAELDQIGEKITLGANGSGGTVRTDATAKTGNLVIPHYTNAEEELTAIATLAGVSVNRVFIGGGASSYNAATEILFHTAANTTTLGGTQIAKIDISGFHVDTIGELTEAAGVTINDEVYLPTIGGSGTGTSIIYFNRTDGELTYGDAPSGGSMVYPDAGIALSTGSAWDTSITDNSSNWDAAYSHSQIVGGDSVHVSTTENTNWDTAYSHVSTTNNPHTVTEVQVLPTQTGHSGEFLTTDGTNSSWAAGGGGIPYPSGSGIPIVVSGTSWGTTITDNSSTWDAAQPGHANLTSVAGLTYASASFVKMTASGTFSLDTATYNNYSHPNHTGHVTSTGDGVTALTSAAITGQPNAGTVLSTDELLLDNAGTIARMDVSVLETYMQTNLSFSAPMVYPGSSGIPTVAGGVAWGTTIANNSTNWDAAYSHSSVTTGNPHSVDSADILTFSTQDGAVPITNTANDDYVYVTDFVWHVGTTSFYIPGYLRPVSTGNHSIGVSAAYWGASYINTMYVESTATYITRDGSNNMTFTDANSGTKTLADLSSELEFVADTGSGYTFILTDAGKIVTFSNSTTVTVTVPTNSSVAFPIGTTITIIQIGAGQVDVSGASLVDIYSADSALSLRAQYSSATLIKYAADAWYMVGDIEA